MKKRIVTIASMIALFASVLCGCGQSNTVAQERRAVERESSGTSIQTTENTANIQAEKGEVDILSSVGSTNTPAVTNEKSDVQESDEKERIVWVKDTEIERNMKTGNMVTWQHECKVNNAGLVEEDYATQSNGNEGFRILRYRYDSEGNCTWECNFDSDLGTGRGNYYEYDSSGNLILEIPTGYGMDEEEWREFLQEAADELANSGEELDKELVAAIADRYELYKQYTMHETYNIAGDNVSLYFFPNWIYQYESDLTGKYLRATRLMLTPRADIEILYDYESIPSGYIRTHYVYQHGELGWMVKFHFDSQDREVERETLDIQGNRYDWHTTAYDSDGNMTERSVGNRSSITSVTRYEYDENGNMISEKKYDYTWSEDIPYETHEYTYKSVMIQG